MSDQSTPVSAHEQREMYAAFVRSFVARAAGAKGRTLGSLKTAAVKAGLSFEDYLSRVESGMKRCTRCKEWKTPEWYGREGGRWDGLDPRCLACRGEMYTEAYILIPPEQWKPKGAPREAPRDGDKFQARHLINLDVEHGRRPKARDLHCVYCGHKGDDRRHEYHHHMGYSARHHYDVVPTCSACHHQKEREPYVKDQNRVDGDDGTGRGNGARV